MSEKKRSVLVIDDEQLILKTIERALLKVGYDVTAVADRKGFLEALSKTQFDLCIVDLKMKELSFEEVKKRVRDGNAEARIIIVSGSLYKGKEAFLQKPFRIDELRSIVRKVLRD